MTEGESVDEVVVVRSVWDGEEVATAVDGEMPATVDDESDGTEEVSATEDEGRAEARSA